MNKRLELPASRRWSLALGLPALAGVIALGGCTGSSGSSHESAAPSGSASSSRPVEPVTGPAPSGAPVGRNTFTYSKVGASTAKKIQTIVQRAPGVLSTAYFPNTHDLEIDVKPAATTSQRTIIKRLVEQQIHPAPKPSKTKKHHS